MSKRYRLRVIVRNRGRESGNDAVPTVLNVGAAVELVVAVVTRAHAEDLRNASGQAGEPPTDILIPEWST